MNKLEAIRLQGTCDSRFAPISVLDSIQLMYSSASENSNKFYKAKLETGRGTFKYRILAEYGRLNARTPAIVARYSDNLDIIEENYHYLINSKHKEGYATVETNNNSTTPVVMQGNKVDLSAIHDKVLKFVAKIYQEATGFLMKTVSTPLGALSYHQVQRGQSVLNEIEDLLRQHSLSSYELEGLSNKYYSIIPTVFGNKIDKAEYIIDDFNKLSKQRDVLGVINSVVEVRDMLNGTLQEKYDKLGASLELLDKSDSEYAKLVRMVKQNRGYNHHIGVDIKNIYVVNSIKNVSKFNPKKVETSELFHGTRNANMLSILQNGLKIKPSCAVQTGDMFGKGIYFADCSTKSANYCKGFSGTRKQVYDENYLLVCEVATGKIKKYDNAQCNLTKAPRGYNSVMGCKGMSLLHNEYIVFNENQARIKYVLEFTT